MAAEIHLTGIQHKSVPYPTYCEHQNIVFSILYKNIKNVGDTFHIFHLNTLLSFFLSLRPCPPPDWLPWILSRTISAAFILAQLQV